MLVPAAFTAEIRVANGGSIQGAIDVVNPGDTIIVEPTVSNVEIIGITVSDIHTG